MSRLASGYDPMMGPRTTGTVSTTKARVSVYDRNLHRARHSISLSSLSFLFMEMVSMNLNQSKSLMELERKLNNLGYSIGLKMLELASLRENFNNNLTSSGKSNMSKRNIKVLEILHFITSTIWPSLFGKPADNLEKSSESASQYMIIDNAPLLMQFVSVPKEYEGLNCEAFVAGIVEGVLDSAFFKCEVTAHTVPVEGFAVTNVVYKRKHNVLKPKSTNIIAPIPKKFNPASPETSKVIGQSTLDILPGANTPPMLVYSSSSILNENNLSVTSTPYQAPIQELPEISDLSLTAEPQFVKFLSKFGQTGSKSTKKVGFQEFKNDKNLKSDSSRKHGKKKLHTNHGLLQLDVSNYHVTRFLNIPRSELRKWSRRDFEEFLNLEATPANLAV
ncbi:hypothetical protein OGAPHI_005931 [Ogataea philodendri]|uniref:Trafficking protein particle complex subunit n=1 Tax=Ogataea philodendri TaxID=1378263 RepID=A0A9P8NXK5_9ASCO|nr:uncharacterized protein OGAPHI_005931 [Ogataea philodendri]KAH3661753.1 hypothetical protein OGAPHI_005931 [Ogataea philodendri]